MVPGKICERYNDSLLYQQKTDNIDLPRFWKVHAHRPIVRGESI